MHDRLLQNTRSLEPFTLHAAAIGLDVEAFDACITEERFSAAVRDDMVLAESAGATGTPSFVLGYTDPDDPDRVTGFMFLKGAHPYSSFRIQIERALREGD